MKIGQYLLALVLVAGLTACSSEKDTSQSGQRKLDTALVSQGEALYKQHCAECHGDKAQGDANWRKPGTDGFYPPPPLNGNGHSWHHASIVLREIITNGSAQGQGKMPAWKDKLSEKEISALVEWIKSQWPDEVYAGWLEIEQRTNKGNF
jgi:mono/diheme cytochrome c family protein